MTDLFVARGEIARTWLGRIVADHTATREDRVAAGECLAAVDQGRRPSTEALGWLAGRALDGVLSARIVLGVLP